MEEKLINFDKEQYGADFQAHNTGTVENGTGDVQFVK